MLRSVILALFTLTAASRAADTTAEAQSLREQGEAELAQGHYPDAAKHAAECARQFHASAGADGEIACWGIAGRAEVYQARYPEAIAKFEQALLLARANNLPANLAAILNDLGNTRVYTGSYALAHDLYTQAQGLVDQHRGEPWAARLRQLTQANLAVLYQRLGQYERALGIYRQIQDSGKLPPAQQAQMLANIGALYRRLGDPYKALDQYRAATQLIERNRDRDSELYLLKMTGIALAMDLQDFPGAESSFDSARRLAEASGNRRESENTHLNLAETLRRMRRFEDAAAHASTAVEGAAAIGAAEDQWSAIFTLGHVEEDRGNRSAAIERYDQAIGRIEALRTGLGTSGLRSSFLGDKRDVYDGAVRVRLGGAYAAPDAAQLFRLMEQGRARSLKDRSGSATGASLAEIARRLPASTALLEYWTSGSQAAVVWATHGASGVQTFPAPSAAELADFAAALRNGSANWRDSAQRLGPALLGVLQVLPPTITRLVVVPDAALASFPFESLFLNPRELLLERYTVSYLPAASLLPEQTSARGWRWPWSKELAAFADPQIVNATAGALYSSPLPRLPGARDEAQDIAAIVGGAREVHLGADNLKGYLGTARLSNIPLLHFATHAIADMEDADRSRLVFSSTMPGAPADFLFAREIADLDLRRVRLVTLAACDTETGQALAGEGVIGLSRAFLAAGAQAAVSTLWRVGDQSSAELMRRFYRRLARGEPAAQALREAKLDFVHSNGPLAHPRYWSAFVLNGDPQTALPRAVPVTAGAGVLIAAACLAWLIKSKVGQASTPAAGLQTRSQT